MNRAQRRKAESERRARGADLCGYIVISSDDLVARPPPDLAEAAKAAGINPNIPYNGLPSPWKRDDAEWFEAHPQRAHRVRNRFPGEPFNDTAVAPPDTVIDKVVIRQIRPGLRVKVAFAVAEDNDPVAIGLARAALACGEHTEPVAHALFDLAKNHRLLDFHELLAMINQHEAAAGRAAS